MDDDEPMTEKSSAKKKQDRLVTGTLAAEVAALQGDPNFMLSLGRGLAVLSAFGMAKRKLTVAEVGKITGMPHQAVRRCLYTYCQLGFIGRTGVEFQPLPRLLSLGYVFFTVLPFPALARPVLENLHRELGIAISLGVFDDDEVTYAIRTGGGPAYVTESMPRLATGVPDRRPAYCTAPGRVLLAALSRPMFEAYLQRTELKPWTERTVTSTHILRAAVEQVREDGYAVIDQEVSMGLRSIAVPIRNQEGEVSGALGGLAICAQWTIAQLEAQVLPALQRAAKELSPTW